MKRLEGIVLGDAFAVFDASLSNEMLKLLKDPLIAQLLDRRSSIVRQATKLLCTMGSCLGQRMDFLAEQLVPTLFKVVVITVQIMAESADSCVRHLLMCCQSHRLLNKICVVIMKDRSSKLRTHCLEYLQLVLDEWHAGTIERALDTVIEAVRHGLSDADAEARATARRCFSSFSHVWPDAARALLEQLDGSLQRIVVDSLGNTGRAESGRAGGTRAGGLQRRERPASARPTRTQRDEDLGPKSGRPRTAASRTQSSSSSVGAAATAAAGTRDTPDHRAAMVGDHGTAPASLGPASLRMKNGGASERVALVRVSANTLDKERPQSRGTLHPAKSDEDMSRKQVQQQQQQQQHYQHDEHEKQSSSGNIAISAAATAAPGVGIARPGALSTQRSTLNDILSMCSMTELSRAGVDSRWMLKVDMLNDLKEFVIEREDEVSGLPVTEVEKVVDILCTNVSHPHAKVASAALDCLAELTPVCMPALNAFLERLLPLLFPRLVDAKQIIRELATEVLTAIGSNSSPDMLLPGLIKSLDAVRTTKGRIGIVEFSAHYLVGDVDVLDTDAHASHAQIRREWLEKLVPFFSDKNAELRSASTQCIIAVYNSDVGAISADVLKLPLDVREVIVSLLARELPELEDAAAPRRASARMSHGVHGAGAPASSKPLATSEEKEMISRTGVASGQLATSTVSASAPPPVTSTSGGNGSAEAPGIVDRQAPSTTTGTRDMAATNDSPAPAPAPARAAPASVDARARNIDTNDTASARRPVADNERSLPPVPPRSKAAAPSTRRPSSSSSTGAPSTTSASNGKVATLMKELPLLIANATMGGGSRVGIVDDIGRLAETSSQSPMWIQYFPQSLMVVMEALGNASHQSDAQGLERAVLALQKMVVCGPEHFAEYMDLVVPRLLETLAAVKPGVRQLSEEVLEQLFDLVDAQRCADALLKLRPHARCDDDAGGGMEGESTTCMLQFAIKMLNRTVVRMDEGELKQYVPRIFPGLLSAFSSSSADNRKAVVFILVDIYLILGSWLESHLSPLSTSQHKLLTIYINRAIKMREQDSASNSSELSATISSRS